MNMVLRDLHANLNYHIFLSLLNSVQNTAIVIWIEGREDMNIQKFQNILQRNELVRA